MLDNKLGIVDIFVLPYIPTVGIQLFVKPLSCHATGLLMIFQGSKLRSNIHPTGGCG